MDYLRIDLSYLFLILPVLIFIYFLYRNWRFKIIKTIFPNRRIRSILEKKKYFHFFNFLVLMFSSFFIIVCLIGPRKGLEKEIIKREGVDVIFVLDVSKSMLAEDVKPNRFKKSKQILIESIRSLKGDRVGVIIYAGDSYPLVPLTLDYQMAISLVKNIDADMISSKGTDLSNAISLSIDYFDDEKKSKALFVLSDGEDHGETYDQINKEIKEHKIIINTICVGNESPVPIPIRTKNGFLKEYKKDKDGEVVNTKIDKEALKNLSSNSNGSFFHTFSNNNQKAINFVKKKLDNLEKNMSEEEIFMDYKERFQWFAGIALFLLIVNSVFLKK